MKLTVSTITFFLCCVFTANAGYDYIIESGYTPGKTLQNSEALLITGGG